jgi:hypothetical protein
MLVDRFSEAHFGLIYVLLLVALRGYGNYRAPACEAGRPQSAKH